MVVSNKERIGRALDLVKSGLLPFVTREMEAKYGADWQQLLPRTTRSPDTQALLRCMTDNWNDVFGATLDPSVRNLVFEMRDARNKWAHDDHASITLDDAYRAQDTAVRLLRAISATQADEIERERRDILLLLAAEQAKGNPQQSVSASPSAVSAGHPRYVDMAAKHARSPIRSRGVSSRRASRLCECGCGEETAGGRFRPGHDGRLKGMLIRTARAEEDDKDVGTCEAAWNRLVELGWSYMFDEEQTRITAEMNRRKAARFRHT